MKTERNKELGYAMLFFVGMFIAMLASVLLWGRVALLVCGCALMGLAVLCVRPAKSGHDDN